MLLTFQSGFLPDCLPKMHARWFILMVLIVGIALSSGCMSRQLKGEPDVRMQRLGFQAGEKNSIETNGGELPAVGIEKPASANQQSSTANGIAAPPDGQGDVASPQASASQPSQTPALGTALAAQRPSVTATDETPPALGSAPAEDLAETKANAAVSPSQSDTQQHEQSLMAVVAELETMGELDAETKRQLIADLRETKPALWQPMLSIYRLALATRKRNESNQPPVPPVTQALASDGAVAPEPAAILMQTLPGSGAKPALVQPEQLAASAARAEAALPTHATPSQRPSPLRPAQPAVAISRSYPSEQSDSEVQAARFDVTEEDLVDNTTTARKPRDRAIRLASATATVASAPRKGIAQRLAPEAQQPAEPATRAEELADWQSYLQESILMLEQETAGPARTPEEVRRQAELRLLYLAGGDREAALRPIEGISTTQQEFWSEGLFALATYLDAESLPDGPRRAAEARRHLEAALTRLGELSTLSVRNMAFCNKVNSFGIYETYANDEFEPGQQVLLYAELENFKCEETAEGFVTSVRSSYQIFDARGVRVESHDFATTDETCRNRRRDFFMRYFIDLPTRIYDGDYTLKLTIEDMKGQTSGEATIPFRIKEQKQVSGGKGL